jgi:transposase InsO family protein
VEADTIGNPTGCKEKARLITGLECSAALFLRFLDMYVFQTLEDVREQTEIWLKEYSEERPHESLGNLTPKEYLLTNNSPPPYL